MSLFNVALLQMSAKRNDQNLNLLKGDQFCREACSMGADIALFPEMWNIGYIPPFENAFDNIFDPTRENERKAWMAQAIDENSSFFLHFKDLAKELNMAIAITYLEKWPDKPRNTVSIIDRLGNLVLTYAKVHTCDFSMEALCTPGDDFYVWDLDTNNGIVKLGTMICYDREFPESARILMLKGAEIILTPNACEIEENRMMQFKTRAYENMVGMALANYADAENKGHSVAFDPICFDKNGSRNNVLIEAGEAEGIYICKFDMDKIRAYRESETWGNSYRKPKVYGILVSEVTQYPFIRHDAKR
jgi:N-carbamoylputrescine amidase